MMQYLRRCGGFLVTPFMGVGVFIAHAAHPDVTVTRLLIALWAIVYALHTWLVTREIMWWDRFGKEMLASAYAAGVQAGRVEDKPWLQEEAE